MFEVQVETARNRIYVALTGFASLEDVQQFENDLKRALDRLPANRGPHQMLYDVSGAQIQSQDVVRALRRFALDCPPTSAFALVNGSALAGRQLSRIFRGIAVHACGDREEAVKWLNAQRII